MIIWTGGHEHADVPVGEAERAKAQAEASDLMFRMREHQALHKEVNDRLNATAAGLTKRLNAALDTAGAGTVRRACRVGYDLEAGEVVLVPLEINGPELRRPMRTAERVLAEAAAKVQQSNAPPTGGPK